MIRFSSGKRQAYSWSSQYLIGLEKVGHIVEVSVSSKSPVPDRVLPSERPSRFTLVRIALSHPERVSWGGASVSSAYIQALILHFVSWFAEECRGEQV